MKKLSIVVLGAMLFSMSSVYAETQPTVENAQKFISEVLNAKATRLSSYPPSGASNAKFNDKKITSASGEGCTTKVNVSYWESNIIIPNGTYKSNTMTIAWNNISSVKQEKFYGKLYETIEIGGSIAWGNGTTSDLAFYADSVEMATRLTNAMNFLREQCDTKKSQYGF